MKKLTLVTIISIFILALLSITYSFSWLGDNGMLSAFGADSTIYSTYFESGDGTTATQRVEGSSDIGCAYEIKYPIQLYYLAWLQELGYFNLANESDFIPTTYFYLSSDLDMTGFTLPPIGTQQYPFIGNFDGNGHIISNLTVKNNNSELTDSPKTSLNYAEIIGFFGVVGSLSAEGKITCSEVSGDTFVPGSTSCTYSSQSNEVKNVTLDSPAITTSTSASLMGIVAGYANGLISNVKVSSSATINKSGTTTTLSSYTNNLSDYTLVGFVTDNFKDSSDVVFVKVATPTNSQNQYNYANQGATSGWGGSIDMLSVYTRINTVRSAATTSSSFRGVESRVTSYSDGTTYDKSFDISNSTLAIFRSKVFSLSSNSLTAGSFSFSKYSTTAEAGTTGSDINYLYGIDDSFILDTFNIQETNETESAFYIKSGTIYLSLNANRDGISATTTPTTKWVMENEGYIRTQGSDKHVYYLSISVINLIISPHRSTATKWTRTGDTLSSGNLSLKYDNGWVVLPYYTISSGTKYLNATSATTLGTGASSGTPRDNNNTLWKFSTVPGGSTTNLTVSTTINNIVYYLKISNGSLSLTTDLINLRAPSSGSAYTIRTSSTPAYYVRYNNNNVWTGSTTSTALTLTPKNFPLSFEATTVTKLVITTTSQPNAPADTWFPLGVNGDTDRLYNVTNDSIEASNSNTGYVVSGSNYKHAEYPYRSGDIRVSKYPISNYISSSFSNNSFTTVYTVNASGRQTITDATSFVKYANSKARLESILSNQTSVYGLHFMDATIDMNDCVTASTVVINENTYNNYQLPRNSIDFHIKKKGYINFFAGTYFDGNTSFFSLHVIERDSNNAITAIKEIKEIYKSSNQSKPYIYKYSDGLFSAVKTSDYSDTPVFDTNWITSPGTALTEKFVYYFEIPVNEGEFALGSVENKDGAYLLYLDIAANAQIVNRATVVENFEEKVDAYVFPTGVTFAQTNSNTLPIPSAVANMITTNTSVSVTNITDSTLTISGMNNISYVADGVTVNGNVTIGSPPNSSALTKIRRTTYYDYNTTTNKYTITEIAAIKVGSNPTTFTINAWVATYNGGTWTKSNQIAANINPSNVNLEEGDGFYLYAVGSGEDAQTLRFEDDVFTEIGAGTISEEMMRNSFYYKISENDGTVINYTYISTITDNYLYSTGTDDLFIFGPTSSYSIVITTSETVTISNVTGSSIAVSNTVESGS